MVYFTTKLHTTKTQYLYKINIIVHNHYLRQTHEVDCWFALGGDITFQSVSWLISVHHLCAPLYATPLIVRVATSPFSGSYPHLHKSHVYSRFSANPPLFDRSVSLPTNLQSLPFSFFFPPTGFLSCFQMKFSLCGSQSKRMA